MVSLHGVADEIADQQTHGVSQVGAEAADMGHFVACGPWRERPQLQGELQVGNGVFEHYNGCSRELAL
jgi:hypothetical protein